MTRKSSSITNTMTGNPEHTSLSSSPSTPPSNQQPAKISVSLQLKSKPNKKKVAVPLAFGLETVATESLMMQSQSQRNGDTIDASPLVIPVANNLQRLMERRPPERQQSLKEEAEENNDNNHHRGEQSTFAFTEELQTLPEAPTVDSESFERVPVTQFGAALLRGMGWNDDSTRGTNNNNSSKDDDIIMPRPHRLGLGAIPRPPDNNNNNNNHQGQDAPPTRNKRKIDSSQQRQQEALLKQQQELQQQAKQQARMDKQRTLQNQSIVYVSLKDDGPPSSVRAKIIQLVGVPGLNQVKIQLENESQCTIVQRRQIQDLVPRDCLTEDPFVEPDPEAVKDQTTSNKVDQKATSRQNDNGEAHDHDSHSERKHKRQRREDDKERKKKDRRDDNTRHESSKRSSSSPAPPPPPIQWMHVNIRIRVITEKLGRKYYKSKGVIVDVTPKGATVRMDDGSLLDRVPERYLETALPKTGGRVLVLAGKHKLVKGQLLERDSKKGRGVVQVYEDMNVLTLSLDDMAEWCGPLDDDDHGHH